MTDTNPDPAETHEREVVRSLHRTVGHREGFCHGCEAILALIRAHDSALVAQYQERIAALEKAALCQSCGSTFDSEHCPESRREEQQAWADEARRQAERAEMLEGKLAEAKAGNYKARYESVRDALLDSSKALAERARQVEALEQLVCDFQAASMLNDSSGDPGTIKPSDVEREITGLRGQVEALREALQAVKLRIHYIGMPQEPRREDGVVDWRKEIALIEAALSGAPPSRVEALREELAALKALDASKSPCGHFAAHATTRDGGKTITCLECEVEALTKRLEAQEQWIKDFKDSAQALAREMEWGAWGERVKLQMDKNKRLLAAYDAAQQPEEKSSVGHDDAYPPDDAP